MKFNGEDPPTKENTARYITSEQINPIYKYENIRYTELINEDEIDVRNDYGL